MTGGGGSVGGGGGRGVMAEARPDTPKKYTCACGLSLQDRKSKFAGKCRHCHTRPKYLRGQTTTTDCCSTTTTTSRSSAIANGTTTSSSQSRKLITTSALLPAQATHGDSADTSTSRSSTSGTSTSVQNAAAGETRGGDGLSSGIRGVVCSNTGSTSSGSGGRSSSIGRIGGSGASGAVATTASESSSISSSNRGSGSQQTQQQQLLWVSSRRRSRSMDRYDNMRITDPPAYSPGGCRGPGRGRGSSGGSVRRAESEDTAAARRAAVARQRAATLVTPPPPYEIASQQQGNYYNLPPSYEEALANTLNGLHVSWTGQPTVSPSHSRNSFTSNNFNALTSRTSRVLEEQAAILAAQRETQREVQREAQREAQRQAHIEAQRDAQRETQLERERERDEERMRLRELGGYCGCAKCQGLYYSYYYDDPMNDGGAFPMETQVLMQEVLTDGLAFCSLM